METITPHAFPNPGGIEKPLDTRDIKLGAAGMPVYTHPKALMNNDAWRMPVEYQGKQPACGAHAGAEVKDLAIGSRFTPRFTWADLKTFDGWPINSGTDLRSIFKSITQAGVLDFTQLGNNVSLDELEYAKAPTTVQRANAQKFSGQGYGFITDLSFDGLKQFITDHGPTIVLMRITERFWKDANGNTSWAEKDVLPLAPASADYPPVSGHFVVAHSFDEQYIYFLNHWSEDWGRDGHGYFGANYMPLVNDAGALFLLKFKKDLSFGMTDPDVLSLQKYLNSHGCQVAASGDGSPGHETNYFGNLTKAAVMKFQSMHGISPVSGYFGPLTRAYVQLHP